MTNIKQLKENYQPLKWPIEKFDFPQNRRKLINIKSKNRLFGRMVKILSKKFLKIGSLLCLLSSPGVGMMAADDEDEVDTRLPASMPASTAAAAFAAPSRHAHVEEEAPSASTSAAVSASAATSKRARVAANGLS